LQKITGDQLGSVINLVLTLTGAAIGFGANLLVKRKAGAAIAWYVASMVFLIAAALAGLCVNLTRLLDFRWTTRAARLRQLREEKDDRCPRWLSKLKSEKQPLSSSAASDSSAAMDEKLSKQISNDCEDKYEFWGAWTWRLLPTQFAFFLVGVALLSYAVITAPFGDDSPPKPVTVAPAILDKPPVSPPPPPASKVYEVRPKDTLVKVAKRMCNDSGRWQEIYVSNQQAIGVNANALQPGQKLSLPQDCRL